MPRDTFSQPVSSLPSSSSPSSSSPSRNLPVNKHGLTTAVATFPSLGEATVREVIRTYIAAARSPDGVRKQKHSKATLDLAAMEVGEVRHLPIMAPQSLRARMRFARVLMENEDARWISQTLTSGEFRVTRLEDGAKPRRESHSKTTTALVQLKVGESCILPGIPRKHKPRASPTPSRSYIIAAQRALDDFEARWKFTTTTLGVRATRVR